MKEGLLDRTFVEIKEISRFFNVDDYKEKGYEGFITLNEDRIIMEDGYSVEIGNQIGQKTTQLYDFAWLDISSIYLFDFGTEFTNYRVE